MSDKAKDNGKEKGPEKDKVTFIFCAIRNNYDWQKVAEESGIMGTDGKPSKGAASKRWSRMLKEHGLSQSDLKSAGPSTPGSNKRKAVGKAAEEDDEAETTPSKTKRTRVKAEVDDEEI